MATRKTPATPATPSTAATQPPAPTAPTAPTRATPAKPKAPAVKVKAALPTAPAAAPKPAKPAKAAKVREALVRDSFTMPASDFALIAQLKQRALNTQRAVKKSELLRAGLRALAALEAKALVAALDKLVPIKTGRPKKGH
jgi:hypothetical protein